MCYTKGMKLPKHPFVRKLFLLGFLAVAGVLIGEVFTLLTRPSAHDLLADLRATMLMSQSLEVNGQTLYAEVWQLPATSSADHLKKAAERLLIVGKTVYVFNDTMLPLKGACTYPEDLPRWDVACDYVMDTGRMRVVIGQTAQTNRAMLEMLDGQARAMGWEPVGDAQAFVWKRGNKVLWAKVKEFPGQPSQAVLVEQKEL